MNAVSRFPAALLRVFQFAAALGVATAVSGAEAPNVSVQGVQTISADLHYLRITDPAGELPAAAGMEKIGLILDLRFTRGADGGTTLRNWLRDQKRVVIVLLNASTDSALRNVVAAGSLGPRVLTVAPDSAALTADIAVSVSANEDRRAYDTLGRRTLEDLIASNIDKVRNDEAAMVRRETNGAGAAVAPAPAPKAPPPPPPNGRGGRGGRGGGRGGRGQPPPPDIDLMLQRAVQIHQGLVALGRTP